MENKINEYKEGFRNYADHTPAGAKIVFNMICKEYERKIEEQERNWKALQEHLRCTEALNVKDADLVIELMEVIKDGTIK